MKNIIFSFLALFMMLSFSLQAQSAYKINENSYQKINISFVFGDLKTTDIQTDNGAFSHITMEGCGNSNEVGNPELPVLVNTLEIPIFGDYVLNVYGKDYVIYDAKSLGIAHQIYPAQPLLSKSHQGPAAFIKNLNTYQTDAFYALPLAKFEELGIMRNVNLGQLFISPVQYNPVTQEIKVYHSVEVEIIFKKVEFVKTQSLKELHKSPLFTPSYVINPIAGAKAEFSGTPVKYLVVAHQMFRGALDQFIAWKKRKGFIVEVAYTDEANVGTTTTTIAAYIKSHYTNATPENPAPTYVLLVGDVQQIPSFTGVCLEPGEPDHATDLYYFTWNGGNLPSCYYGRFSAQNLTHLTPQIVKTLQYEQFTMPDPSYLDNICLIAGHDYGGAGLTYGNGFVNYATQNYANTAYGYTNVYAHLDNCSGQAALIRQEIGNGVGIANYTAHCDWNEWSDPSFKISHISAMSNANKYGLMIGNCCLSNQFNMSECFGEALLRAANKGAVGYIGGSDYTYWNPDYYWAIGARTSISANPTYDATRLGAYDRLFHTHGETNDKWMTTFGSMIKAGNDAVQQSSVGSSYKKYYWEIYHLMGDPSLMTYLTQPSQMEVVLPDELFTNQNTLTAQVAPYSYCALTGIDGELISTGFAGSDGNITLTFNPLEIPGEYEFAAWAQKYIQYFKTIQCISEEGGFITGSFELNTESTLINNGQIFFDISLKNIGVAASSEIIITLNTESDEVTISDATISIPSIPAGGEFEASKFLKATVKPYTPDETVVVFTFNVESDDNSFQQEIELSIQAPILEITGANIIHDSIKETYFHGDIVDIELEVANIGHNTIFDVLAEGTVAVQGFEWVANKQTIAEIPVGNSKMVTLKGKITTAAEGGSIIPINLRAFKGTYEAESSVELLIDSIPESICAYKTNFFSIHPNPAHATLTIESKTQLLSYDILDITGSVVVSKQNINNKHAQINITSLANGFYFVRVTDEKQQIAVRKFVKQ